MADIASWAALLVVGAMLLLGVWRQFVLLGPRGQLLDSLGLVPQWKFFALSSIATGDAIWDDHHLLVRLADPGGAVSPWEEIFWNEDRRWVDAVWNPQLRPRGEIQAHLARLATGTGEQHRHMSLTYLTILRFCADETRQTEEQALQFSVVGTRGRGARSVAVRFVSAWHTL